MAEFAAPSGPGSPKSPARKRHESGDGAAGLGARRRVAIGGNWKCNGTRAQVEALVSAAARARVSHA
jgi:hypothetical protein